LLPEEKKAEPELVSELQNIRSRLDKLSVEVDEIKKAIEE